jgi:hypothetical protein
MPLQVVLAKLTAMLPSNLSSARLADLSAELQQQCEDVLRSILSNVQQRKAAQDLLLLGDAEHKAFQMFQDAVASIGSGCDDEMAAAQACEVGCTFLATSSHIQGHTWQYAAQGCITFCCVACCTQRGGPQLTAALQGSL